MNAIVYHEYGSPDVLRGEEVDKPAAADDEAVIRVCSASVNPRDSHPIPSEAAHARGKVVINLGA